jgi:mannan endo-1,4-beta-mannosidase
VWRSKQVLLWEAASGRLLAELPAESTYPLAAFHPQGRSLVVAAGRKVQFYELGGLRAQSFLGQRQEKVTECALHPDGRRLACVSPCNIREVGEVTVWPLEPAGPATPTARYHFPHYRPDLHGYALAWHPASEALALCRDRSLLCFGRRAGKPHEALPAEEHITKSAFGPAGRLWLATHVGVEARQWPDGRQDAVWRNKLVGMLRGNSDVLCVAAGRRWVAAGAENGCVFLLRAADARAEQLPQVADSAVRSVALSPDEELVAAGTATGELVLLSVPDGKVLARETAHRSRVGAVSFVGNHLLLSGARDHHIKLWHCSGSTLRELMTLPMPAPVRWLALHPDGVRLLVLLEQEYSVRVWDLGALRERLSALGLGDGLEGIARAELPPAIVPRPMPPPPTAAAPPGSHGLRAELFADINLQRCVKVRYDEQINFNWASGAPDPALPSDYFSIRWTGWLQAPRPGRYRLRMHSDDGARLWLDGKLLIDRWRQGASTQDVAVELGNQPHALRIEYFEVGEAAFATLSWAQENDSQFEPVPATAFYHERPAK